MKYAAAQTAKRGSDVSEGRVPQKQKHALTTRGLAAVREYTFTVPLPLVSVSENTLKQLVQHLPQGVGPAVSDCVTRLARARNYESGEKPTEVRDTLQAVLENTLGMEGSPLGSRAEVRGVLQAIDSAVTESVKAEREKRQQEHWISRVADDDHGTKDVLGK